MRHRIADLNGPVHYIDFGGDGKPMLMVHGLGGNALNWMAVGPELAKDHHAIALDLAGFGQTPLYHRSASVGANADLVKDFIQKVIGEPATLMGNSMGGHIGVLVAADHPKWVTESVLVDPAVPLAGLRIRALHPTMLGMAAAISIPGLAEVVLERRVRELGPERLVQESLALVCADPSRVPADVVEAHVQLTRERGHLGPQNSRAFLQASRSIGLRMADPRFWTKVKRVTAPTLVVHGSSDRIIPVAAARELVRRRPDWTLRVLEGVGHVPMMEMPELFLGTVSQWLRYRIAPESAAVS
ncbi:MAG TPA: alpha/beta hydrolase [Candidatus Dormibacteraeota bacterium]|nr:alpha/beta hydrolase [Candidatus Dormibacteraeota bacterium]